MTKAIFIILILAGLATGCASPQSKKAEVRKKKKIELQALKHYRMGIDAYTNTRYAEAISEWKKTLELEPEHPNAALYIDRAEKARQALKSIEKTPK